MTKMIKNGFCLVLLAASVVVAACGGSGSGGGGGNANAPSISAAYFTPSTAQHSTSKTFTVTFTFSDANGDLDGGTFNWVYNNNTYSTALPSSLAGSTSGTTTLNLQTITLSATVGTVSIPVSLTDKAGNTSSTLYVNITQT